MIPFFKNTWIVYLKCCQLTMDSELQINLLDLDDDLYDDLFVSFSLDAAVRPQPNVPEGRLALSD